jgi:ketosteroid isomerase-like protein
MTSDETRDLVQRFLTTRAANDAEAMAPLLADDVTWQPPASMRLGPFHGRDRVVAALTGGAVGKFLDVSTIRRDVHKLVVDGDTAVALQRMEARTVGGDEYVNEYAWVYTCAGGRITRLDEYADSLHAARLFGLV